MKNKSQKKFIVENKIWLWPGEMSAWHFVTVPPEVASKIKSLNEKEVDGKKKMRRGFSSIKVLVKIGKTTFETSIFPNKRDQTYLLPIKKEVRKKEGLQEGDKLKFVISLL